MTLSGQNRRGFTILELVVVMFVAILVGGLSMGKFHDVADQQKLVRAQNVVRTNIEAAFALAGRNRKPVRLTWDAANMQFDLTDRAGTTVFRRANLRQDPYGLKSGSVTFSTSPVEVYPNGLANTSFTVTLTSPKATRTISVSRAGMVQTQ